ncbi:hypothetical protein UFOVP689_2 [uncultured Caudovirales phage]|uniref:Uncharacterized protein n=1 Tax=uncultured Caudovirales phage TaxID=2100421 RepID=A0A6J5NIV7_9CAUD|nr:hypothetical protein UFOVP689_2 [uncultured Caudovirales phage]
MKSIAHTVTSTRSLVIAKDDVTRTVYLHVTGNGTVYIGGSDVTTVNGMLTEKHAVPFQFILPAKEDLYAITANGVTEDLRIMTPDTD